MSQEEQLTRLFGDLTVVQLILWLFSAAALIFMVWKLWPVITKFVATVNALSDLPTKLKTIDTIESKIVGIESKVAGIESQVQDIHHETHFNSGTSIKDATVRIEEKVDGLQKLMEDADAELAERDDELEGRLGHLENTFNPKENQ